jgi:hypothetical protein
MNEFLVRSLKGGKTCEEKWAAILALYPEVNKKDFPDDQIKPCQDFLQFVAWLQTNEAKDIVIPAKLCSLIVSEAIQRHSLLVSLLPSNVTLIQS